MNSLKNRLTSIILSIGVLTITILGAANIFGESNSKTNSEPNCIHVKKIDENNAKIRCDSIKTSKSDFLFSKSQLDSNSYKYSIGDFETGEKLYEFVSTTDIAFDEGLATNP